MRACGGKGREKEKEKGVFEEIQKDGKCAPA